MGGLQPPPPLKKLLLGGGGFEGILRRKPPFSLNNAQGDTVFDLLLGFFQNPMPLGAGEGANSPCPHVAVRRRSVTLQTPDHPPRTAQTPLKPPKALPCLKFGLEGALITLSDCWDPPPPPAARRSLPVALVKRVIFFLPLPAPPGGQGRPGALLPAMIQRHGPSAGPCGPAAWGTISLHHRHMGRFVKRRASGIHVPPATKQVEEKESEGQGERGEGWWGHGASESVHPLSWLLRGSSSELRKGAPRATSLFPQCKYLTSCLQRFQGGAVHVFKAHPPPFRSF